MPPLQLEHLSLKEKLKKLYSLQNTLPKLIEDEAIKAQSLDEYYIKMQIILKEEEGNKQGTYDKVSGTKDSIAIEDIFSKIDDEHSEAKKILILGGAGVGKTTLLHYMAYRWSDDKDALWNDKFEYVFKVKLKRLGTQDWNKQRGDEKDLKDLIKDSLNTEWSLAKLNKKDHFTKGELEFILDKRENVLLLMDGYDEIAHLANNSDHIASEIIEEILSYPNLILTTRPHARLVSTMVFDRKLENLGLDLDGVFRYVDVNFKEKTDLQYGLKDFLKANPYVQSMCTFPINAAMLCLIWSDEKIREKFKGKFHITNLYQEVMFWLGKRYVKKFSDEESMVHLKKYRTDQEMSESQVLSLEEARLTTEVAYYSFCEKKSRLAVNPSLIQKLIDDNPRYKELTVVMLDKYGLLKPDGIEDVANQNRYFIHLTFQEYLTAYRLKEKLSSKETRKETTKFITKHRNDPIFLTTFKFLAGLISKESDHQLEQAFWDAILCNIDGVIEVGLEQKVTLWMHLFEQVVDKEDLKLRNPNIELMANLIDKVVLENLLDWRQQIIYSGYLSDRMKSGLFATLENDQEKLTQEWQDANKQVEKLFVKKPLLVKVLKETKAPELCSLETKKVIEIIASLLFKFQKVERKELLKIINRFLENDNWEIQLAAINCITELIKILSDNDKTTLDNRIIKKMFSLLQENHNFISALIKCFIETGRFIDVCSGLIELIKTIDVDYTKELAAYAFREVATANGFDANQAIESLIKIIKTAESDDIKGRATEVLGIITLTAKDFDGNKTIEPLIEVIKTAKSDDTKRLAAYALENIASAARNFDGNKAIELLIEVIKTTESDYVKGRAAYALEDIVAATVKNFDGNKTIEPLIEVIKTAESDHAKWRAALALGKIATYVKDFDFNQAIELLVEVIKTAKSDNAKRRAALALGKIKSIKTVKSDYVKGRAADALEDLENIASAAIDFDGNKAIKLLIEVIKTAESDNAKERAVEALREIAVSGKAFDFNQATGPLIEVIKTAESDNAKGWAVEALRKIAAYGKDFDFSQAIKRLIEAIKPVKSDYAKGRAVEALSGIAAYGKDFDFNQAIELLVEVIKTAESDNAKMLATVALRKIATYGKNFGFNQAIGPLIEVIKTEPYYAKMLAASALGEIAAYGKNFDFNQAIELLVEVIKTAESYNANRQEVEALGNIAISGKDFDFSQAIKLLIETIQTAKSDYVKGLAIEALGKIAAYGKDFDFSQAIGLLIEIIKTAKSDLAKRLAVEALEKIAISGKDFDFSQAIELLIETIKTAESDYVKGLAVEALGKIAISGKNFDFSQVIELLIGVMKSTESYVKELAAYALGNIASAARDFDFSQAIELLIETIIKSAKLIDIIEWPVKALGMIATHSQEVTMITDELSRIENNLGLKEIKYNLVDPFINVLNIKSLAKVLKNPPSPEAKHMTIKTINNKLSSPDESKPEGSEAVHVGLDIIEALGSPNKDEKESLILMETVKNLLMKQIEKINDKNFLKCIADSSVKVSPPSRVFFKAVYQEILKDEKITELKKNFIIKCIQNGFTTSITKDGVLIFDEKSYTFKDEKSQKFLEEITQVILSNKNDLLSAQYIAHKPLFQNNNCGLMVAASDVAAEEVKSLLGKIILPENKWLVSFLKPEKRTEEYILLEKKDLFGHVTAYFMDRNKLDSCEKISFHPKELKPTDRERLFEILHLSQDAYQFSRYQTLTVSIKKVLTEKLLRAEELEALRSKQILPDADLAIHEVEEPLIKEMKGLSLQEKQLENFENEMADYTVNKINLLNLEGEQKRDFERDERIQVIIPLVGGLQKEFTSYKNKFNELEDKVNTLGETLEKADITCIAKINGEIDEMKTNKPQLYRYYVTLYWTFSNHLLTYRASANGMLEASGAEGSKAVAKLSTMSSVLGVVSTIASNIPIIGNNASTVIELLGSVVDKVTSLRLEEAIKIVNEVIKKTFPSEAKMYNDIAMFCIAITRIKGQEIKEILDPSKGVKETPKAFSEQLKLFRDAVVDVYKKCKENYEDVMIKGSKKILGEFSSNTILDLSEGEKRLQELATDDASTAIAIILEQSAKWTGQKQDDKLFSKLLLELFIKENKLTIPAKTSPLEKLKETFDKKLTMDDGTKVEDLEGTTASGLASSPTITPGYNKTNKQSTVQPPIGSLQEPKGVEEHTEQQSSPKPETQAPRTQTSVAQAPIVKTSCTCVIC